MSYLRYLSPFVLIQFETSDPKLRARHKIRCVKENGRIMLRDAKILDLMKYDKLLISNFNWLKRNIFFLFVVYIQSQISGPYIIFLWTLVRPWLRLKKRAGLWILSVIFLVLLSGFWLLLLVQACLHLAIPLLVLLFSIGLFKFPS